MKGFLTNLITPPPPRGLTALAVALATAIALPAAAQSNHELREGHAKIIKGNITSVGTIPMTCGARGADACFTVFPTRTGAITFQPKTDGTQHTLTDAEHRSAEASIRALPFLQVAATTDACRDVGPAKMMTVTYTPDGGSSTTGMFIRMDDDLWAANECGTGNMTQYHSGYRHGNDCRAHEEARGEACITRCAAGQIWRKTYCETP